jgi:hypothetical protein
MNRAVAPLKLGRSNPTPGASWSGIHENHSIYAAKALQSHLKFPQTLMGLSSLLPHEMVRRARHRFEPHAPGDSDQGGFSRFRPEGPLTLSSLASASQLLEREAIYSPVGAYVEPILGRDQRLEMMKPGHCGN